MVEIKYRKGIDNVGPDFLMRHELLASSSLPASMAATHSSAPLSQHVSFSKTSSLVSDSPCSPEAWDPVVLSPVVTRLKTSAKSNLSHPAPIHQPFGIFLPDDTYHESSHVPSHVALSCSSPLSANTILNLNLSRIKTEQHSDLDILPIFNSLRTAPSDLQFALQDDVLFHLLPPYNTATFFRVLFLKSLVSRGPHTYHDHPLSGYLDVHRTLTDILSRSWWPHLRQSVQNYIVSCTKRVCHNIVCTKLDGHLTREHPQLSNRFFKEIYLFLGYQLC